MIFLDDSNADVFHSKLVKNREIIDSIRISECMPHHNMQDSKKVISQLIILKSYQLNKSLIRSQVT